MGLPSLDPSGSGGAGSPLPLPVAVRRSVNRAAPLPVTVLIEGPTGTGKTTLARLIHERDRGVRRSFVRVDCAGLVSSLAQDELVGHVSGAFTDARSSRAGLAREADGGTLFFDEIGVLSPMDQARLLTLLEERTVRPVGADREIRVDVRIICATNADLKALVDAGRFREDLYHRCSVFPIRLPRLQDRREEFPAITIYLLHRIIEGELESSLTRPPGIDGAAMKLLMEYPWPGNVRELRNVLVFAIVHGGNERIEPRHLPPKVRGPALRTGGNGSGGRDPERLEAGLAARSGRYQAPNDPDQEREDIVRALQETQTKAGAARCMGMGRTTFYERLRRYRIRDSEWR